MRRAEFGARNVLYELRGHAVDCYPPPPSTPVASPGYEPGANLRAVASAQSALPPSFSPAPAAQNFQPFGYAPQQVQVVVVNQPYKSKVAAGLLAFFLGTLGIHRFYLGYNGIGIAQLLLGLGGWLTCGLTTIVAWVWALIDMILIFTGGISKDAQGQPLI